MLFYLQRQRITEAMQANSRLLPVPGKFQHASLLRMLGTMTSVCPSGKHNLPVNNGFAPLKCTTAILVKRT